ncbi:hypothetical protein NIES2109_22740 [Nostoc sp. HK-01]|nr:hypothetical protein NIES2109_22740 [Nostoc sp. HK-01]
MPKKKKQPPLPHVEFIGVAWNEQHNAWEAVINGKHLGFFEHDFLAALRYDFYASKEDLTPNFPWRAVPLPVPKFRLPSTTQKSEYLGVRNKGDRWCAYYKNTYLGTYNSQEDAAIARDKRTVEKEGWRSKNLSLAYSQSALAPNPVPSQRARSPHGKHISLVKGKHYQVCIRRGGQRYYLGIFRELEEAQHVRDEFCKKHFINTEYR